VTTPPEASLRATVSRIASPLVDSSQQLLHGIACAAAASPAAAQVPGAFVVRTGPRPALAVVGEMDQAAVARVEALFEQIHKMLALLRYVDYAQAERDVLVLADRLRERLGPTLLDEAHFLAIPRGGHIVLGMLVTALGIPASRVGPSDDPDRPVVVVDDCAISGHRFGRWLESCRDRSVVFACLYAHPDLVHRVESQEERVVACVAARDLEDRGSELLGPEAYARWRRRWAAELEAPRFWVGIPDVVVFAWKEPDRMLLNRVNGRAESGWRVFPPQLCLANRSARPQVEVQVQPEGCGPIRPAASVFFAEVDGGLVVADADREAAVRLDPVGAATFRALLARGTVGAAARELQQTYDVDAGDLERDVAALVAALAARGLLEGEDEGAR
jgi:hypothetical protein